MLIVFLAALWDGCTEFSLDRERLERAVAVLDAETRGVDEADFLVAPLVGLQMAVPRLHLPHGVRLVRADAIEAPIEAMRSEGMGRRPGSRSSWRSPSRARAPRAPPTAMRQLHELISVMRLFKAGGVGLGPYAFAPTGEGSWRRIATGAPARPRRRLQLTRPRPRARRVRQRAGGPAGPGRVAGLGGRPLRDGLRPRLGAEGLSDHLLALRAVLDGQGPVGASLPKRAAALIEATRPGRIDARERIEAAIELERSLMPAARRPPRVELAGWLEEGVRGSCARPRSASSAPTSARPPTRA